MKQKFNVFFSSLKSGQKRVLVLMGVGCVLTIIGIASYFSSSRKAAVAQAPQLTKNSVVNMDNHMLQKSELLEAKKDALVAKEKFEELKKQKDQENDAKAKAAAAGLVPPGSTQKSSLATPADRMVTKAFPPRNSMPPLPPIPANNNVGLPPRMPGAGAQAVAEQEIGGISRVSYDAPASKDKESKKKDEKKTVFLPISYMEATLLSGLNAPTSSAGAAHPVPVLIRIKTPAVLPNEVKANLKGCFVIADGKGNLGTERAELVLVSLSCIDRKGQAVINQDITGFVVDGDGKAGLRGRVVTKMGALIARSMIAGLLGGFGDALKSANTTTSLSALGSVSNIRPDQLAYAGLGEGLSSAFKETQKFYLTLAKQTLPVIEVGAARPVTLVLTKGVNLDIMKMKRGI